MEFLSAACCLLLTFVTILAFLLILETSERNKNLPPGPKPLPIIGNLLKIGDQPHKSLAELAKTFGPIMSLRLGQITMIVISSSNIAKEALQKNDLAFSTRSLPNAAYAHAHNRFSVSWFPVGDTWRSLRKIMYTHLVSSGRFETSLKFRNEKVRELVNHVEDCCRRGVRWK